MTTETNSKATVASLRQTLLDGKLGELEVGTRALTLLRESGVVLAALAALLYIASHIYGMEFLEMFGVREGFQGVGLSHLAMVPVAIYIMLGGFTFVVYRTLTTDKKLWLVAGNAMMLGTILTRPIYSIIYGTGQQVYNLTGLCFGLVMILISILVHGSITPRMAKLRGNLEEGIKKLETNQHKLDVTETELLHLDADISKAETMVAAVETSDAQRTELNERIEAGRRMKHQTAEIREAHERTVADGVHALALAQTFFRRYRLGMYAVAGALMIYFAIPAVATIDAMTAAGLDRFAAFTPNGLARKPVYWVGDRVVYLTTEGSKCYVHVQIANVEQERRECPPLIAAASE